MLPSILAEQLQKGLVDYIETTYPMSNPYFQGSLESMDSWVRGKISVNDVPRYILRCLNNIPEKNKQVDIAKLNKVFPYNFLDYVKKNLNRLLNSFIDLFRQYLTETAENEIREYAKGNGLQESPMNLKVLETFESLKAQLDSFKGNLKALKKLRSDLEAKPQDSSTDGDIKEINSEIEAMNNVIKSIQKKNVFNFLSDEGLLPNYAFPEVGVILKAILYRQDESQNTDNQQKTLKKYEKKVYEFSRSASSAISEFAPDNTFYANGHKLKINRVDLATRKEEKWRLCPNCAHGSLDFCVVMILIM